MYHHIPICISTYRSRRDRMIVRFTTTHAISVYYQFESCTGDTALCDKVCGLRQVGGFLQVRRFPPPIKLTAMI